MTLNVYFKEDEQTFNACFGEVQKIIEYESELPVYNGSYDVIPKIENQKLETAQKIMSNDLTVLAIPYAEVSNTANGKTVTIG